MHNKKPQVAPVALIQKMNIFTKKATGLQYGPPAAFMSTF